jgi:hypothetical protein
VKLRNGLLIGGCALLVVVIVAAVVVFVVHYKFHLIFVPKTAKAAEEWM